MNEINELIKTIKQSKLKNKEEYLLAIKDIVNSFVDYTNAVIDIEMFSQAILEWDAVTSYMYKQKDEERSIRHNICIDNCVTLNKIAEDFDFDLYINTSDRHEVACFVSDSIKSIFDKGINRTYDEMVMEYSKNLKSIQKINNIEELSYE